MYLRATAPQDKAGQEPKSPHIWLVLCDEISSKTETRCVVLGVCIDSEHRGTRIPHTLLWLCAQSIQCLIPPGTQISATSRAIVSMSYVCGVARYAMAVERHRSCILHMLVTLHGCTVLQVANNPDIDAPF